MAIKLDMLCFHGTHMGSAVNAVSKGWTELHCCLKKLKYYRFWWKIMEFRPWTRGHLILFDRNNSTIWQERVNIDTSAFNMLAWPQGYTQTLQTETICLQENSVCPHCICCRCHLLPTKLYIHNPFWKNVFHYVSKMACYVLLLPRLSPSGTQ